MDAEQAVDDLKTIRQIMEHTRRATEGSGGWFMVLWGIIWLLDFAGVQFLADKSGWVALVLNPIGMVITIWLAVRMEHQSGTRTAWLIILFWWLSLTVFGVLVAVLFHLNTSRDLVLLIALLIALGYVQFGLFTHWAISATGALIAALAVAAALLLPGYFFLAVAIAGGGVLIGSGLWLVRRGGK
jgi:hypothetical protein